MPVTYPRASLLSTLPTLALVAFACCVQPVLADPPAVATQHYDNLRTGANTHEVALNPATVNSKTFGKLFTLMLDASVNGQPLYVPSLVIQNALHNVVFVYTSSAYGNNSPSSVYALDADNPKQSAPLWRHQLPFAAEWTTCTPVIDVSRKIIYLVTKTTDDNGPTYMRALNLLTGAELPGSPIQISASLLGTGDGSKNGVVSFDTTHANCRAGLVLVNGIVYCAFSHGSDSFPYHGWVFGYSYEHDRFTQTAFFCTNPNGGDAGVWHAGKGLVADSKGNLYCVVGNGTFDAAASLGGGIDYGMCYLKLGTPNLNVLDYFAAYDEKGNSDADLDTGGAGIVGIPGTDRLFGGGTKFGSVFLLDSTDLGGYQQGPNGKDKVVQRFDNVSSDSNVGQNPIAWNAGSYKYVYVWPQGASLLQYRYDPKTKEFDAVNSDGSYKQAVNDTAGGALAITSSGTSGAVLWALGDDSVFRAFDATDVSQPELWDSNIDAGRDGIPSVGHWQFPMIVNGRAYVPTGSSTLAVYGLLPTGVQKTLTPTADAYIEAGASADTNFGGGAQLQIEKVTSDSSSSSNRAAYLKFDLTNVTTPPTRASLKLTVNSASSPAGKRANVGIYYVSNTAWTQTGLTWNNAPGLNRTVFSSTGVLVTSQQISASAATVTIDLTSLVTAHLGKVITLQLLDAAKQSVDLILDSATAGNSGPQLTITD